VPGVPVHVRSLARPDSILPPRPAYAGAVSDFVPIAEFVSYQEAFPMAGRLRADGIDAQVITQGDSLYPYRGYGGPGHMFCVIVPSNAADRSLWILRMLRGGDDAPRS